MTETSRENNQNAIKAVVICVLIAYLYAQFFLTPKQLPPPPAGSPAVPAVTQSETAKSEVVPAQPAAPVTVVSAPPTQGMPHPTHDELLAAGTSFIESDKTKIVISHLGARFLNYKLSNYRVDIAQDVALDLSDNLDGVARPLGVYAGNVNDERVAYSLVSVNGSAPTSTTANVKLAADGKVALEYKGTLPNGIGITKKITLSADSYLFNVDVALSSPLPAGQEVWVEWNRRFPADASARTTGMPHVTYLDGFDKIQHVPEDEASAALRDLGTSRWIALGDLYFMAAMVPSGTGRNTLIAREGDLYTSRVAGTQNGGAFTLFAGPKVYKMLEGLGSYELQRSIDLGMFTFLALPLLWLLHALFSIVGNYGLAIIALTLIVKAVMLPLSKASFRSMKQMQEVQPEIKALRERIKDPNQLNQEIFALYKRRGVNPMGGCLPIALQIPVFLGLYQALLNAIELRHAPYALWITDLSSPEKLQLFGIGIPVMVLLMAASMIIQQWTTPNPSADPAQQKAMMLMPIIFAGMFIIYPMPAGLVLYWLVNNIISITQQMYLRGEGEKSVYLGTVVASAAIFGVGFILTLI